MTSRCNQGATAEADTFEEQQQVKWPQLGSSSWSGYCRRVASYPDLLTPAFVQHLSLAVLSWGKA